MSLLDPSVVTEPVVIETYAGLGGLGGHSYAVPVVTRCQLEATRKLVRSSSGAEVVSETTIRLSPQTDRTLDLEQLLTPESRVTVRGRTSTVITVSPVLEDGRLSHLAAALT